MKAKDYAEKYKKDPSDKGVLAILYDVFMEAKEIQKQRKARDDYGFIPIIKEQDSKWRAFCRLVDRDDLRNAYTRFLINEVDPNISKILKER